METLGMTGAEFIAKYLSMKGVTCAFGIPGNQLNELLIEMNNNAIEFILARHEGGASLMAEGYARISKKVGICITIPGPGASNAYTGILEAYNNCTPVLLITIHQDSKIETDDYSSLFHGLNHQNAFKPVTKWRCKILKIQDLVSGLAGAFNFLELGRPGPVLLEFSEDVFTSILPENFLFLNQKEMKFAQKQNIDMEINKAIEMIQISKYPFILAGEGVYYADASEELLNFASKINSPVATTTLGKGAISEYEDLSLGSITDMLFTDKYILKLLNKADLVIAVGVKFTQIDTNRWDLDIKCPLIHIDSDQGVINKQYKCEIGIVSNIKDTLKRFHANISYSSMWKNEIKEVKSEKDTHLQTPLINAIREVMDKDSIFVADINIDADYALARYKVFEPWNFLFPGISLLLGYSIPEAIGAQIARPDLRTIVLCGDGGFIMSSQEIATIIKYDLNIVILIVNDNAYGTVKYKQLRQYNETIGVELVNPDFLKFAEAYGIFGMRINRLDSLKEKLREILQMNKAAIVEIDKQILY